MASERFLSEYRGAFWRQVLPNLTGDYVRSKNKVSRLVGVEPGGWESPATYNDLIGETSFGCVMRHVNTWVAAEATAELQPEQRAEHGLSVTTSDLEYAVHSLTTIANKRFESYPIPESVTRDAGRLAGRLANFLPTELATAVFHPRLKGFGLLDACHPDIATQTSIIEVKSSKDGFRREDFKQLFIYAYLAHRAGSNFSSFILLNPRTAQRLTFSHQQLADELSGQHYSAAYALFDQILQRPQSF